MSSGQRGSVELVVLGLLAALIVVLALPLLTGVPEKKPGVEPRLAKVAVQVPAAVNSLNAVNSVK